MPRRWKRIKVPMGPRKRQKQSRKTCKKSGGTPDCIHDFDDKIACVSWYLCYCGGTGGIWNEWTEARNLPNCTPKF